MKNLTWILAAALAGACAPPGTKLIDDAAAALGGKDRIRAVRTLVIEGEGEAPNLGQNRTPESELPVWKIDEFKRAIDPANGRMQVELVRTAQFLFAGANTQRQRQGLDGDVAFNVGPDGTSFRVGEAAARDRRLELLHHPLTIVRAALDPAAKLGNFHRAENLRVVDITTAAGDTLTLAVDDGTNLPVSVTSMTDQPNLGDVAVETTFADYESVNGIELPRRLSTKIDRYPQFDLRVTSNAIDAEAGELSAPEAVKSAPPPQAPAVVVTAEPVAQGIWWLAGSGNHRSVVFEFGDHLTIFEVPLGEARSKAVIDKARTLSSKPLTHAIISHHHFDHSGGLRVAVAEGLTIITYRQNVDFFKNLLARSHTIAPDALAKNPRALQIEPVDDHLMLKDNSMEVHLYHLTDNPREGTNLYAYVPRDRILVQADLYDSTWLYHYWWDNVMDNLKARGLRVDRSVPVHGAMQSFAELLKTVELSKTRGARRD